MPNRILHESINESRGLAEVSAFAQDLYKRLITYADDYGRFNADVEIMRARLYPRELAAVTEDDLDDALVELAGVGKLRFYTGSTRRDGVFGYFPHWAEHQRMRDSRARCPDPESEEVNDWYLRRFVPQALKLQIFLRDGFTCQQCGRCFELAGIPPRQAARVLTGALHLDHVVPILQGGRATAENLRLLCASCNLSRPKRATLDELAQLTASRREPPQVAANGREPPRAAATGGLARAGAESESNPNPIRIQSGGTAAPAATPPPRVGLPEFSENARAVLETWRCAHGKRSPPKLTPAAAAKLEEAVLDLGVERLCESARWTAERGLSEFHKTINAARTKRQLDEGQEVGHANGRTLAGAGRRVGGAHARGPGRGRQGASLEQLESEFNAVYGPPDARPAD